MAVTGWTERLEATWTGDEASSIKITVANKNGILTRDANDGITDFVFTTDVDAPGYGNSSGGIVFRCDDAGTQFYYITYVLTSNGAVDIYLQQDTLVLGDNVIDSVSYPDGTFTAGTQVFTFVLTVSGTSINFIMTDSLDETATLDTTSSIYNGAGVIGYGNIQTWDSTGISEWMFTSIVDTGGGPTTRRRVMIIS